MKRLPRSILTNCWTIGLLISCLLSPVSTRSQDVGPCDPSWLAQPWPNLDWGMPPTLGGVIPVEYYDSETVSAFFLVPLSGLHTFLPAGVRVLAANDPLSPWSVFGSSVDGFGIVLVDFSNFRSVRFMGPYQECSFFVLVYDRSLLEGFGTAWFPIKHVLTSEPCVWGGIAGWGFPKVVGQSHFHRVGSKGFKCFSSIDDELIVKMEINTDDLAPMVELPMMLLTLKDGYLVRTPVETMGTRVASFTPGKSTLKLGHHAISQMLREIGLGIYPSVGQMRGEHLQSRLPAGNCEKMP